MALGDLIAAIRAATGSSDKPVSPSVFSGTRLSPPLRGDLADPDALAEGDGPLHEGRFEMTA